jgi:hypothetical protein
MSHFAGAHTINDRNSEPETTHRKGIHSQSRGVALDVAPLICCIMPAKCLGLYVGAAWLLMGI